MAKYKILVGKLLMKNGKMASAHSVHDETAFNRPVSELEAEKYIAKAGKADLEEGKKEEKETTK
jgi:hypothetical protein